MHDRRRRRRIWITKGSAGTDRQRHTEFTNKNVRSHQGTQQRIKTYWICERCNPLTSLRLIVTLHTHSYTPQHLLKYIHTHAHTTKRFLVAFFALIQQTCLYPDKKIISQFEELLLLISLLVNQEKWSWNCCFNFVWFSKWFLSEKNLVRCSLKTLLKT